MRLATIQALLELRNRGSGSIHASSQQSLNSHLLTLKTRLTVDRNYSVAVGNPLFSKWKKMIVDLKLLLQQLPGHSKRCDVQTYTDSTY